MDVSHFLLKVYIEIDRGMDIDLRSDTEEESMGNRRNVWKEKTKERN